MRDDNGGPAFPLGVGHAERTEGMTLRDYFAAKAMQGMMARDSFDPGQSSPSKRAHLAYLEAEAMLAERTK